MPKQPLFSGLVFDENDRPAETAYVGDEPCYVVDDAGFKRHIPSEQVDRAVLSQMQELIKGSENLVGEQAAKMIGQDDPFSVAAIASQLKNLDKQFDQMLQAGFPEEARAYLGMLGFKIVINYHGEVVSVNQPGAASDDDSDE
ncbi:MAG: hypothetical protein JETCAE02_04360 [Anaerolineaceae bacterium]|jgi:hypothetical protein|nr:hypothetical protein [Anaerolineae bacterium]MBL1172572.1 hypothetical protein [Chloroflexota bacterium]MBV6466914.1 hypothetical protein [Anaerolineales bacterium]MCE7906655.1 hypothetical protein [Anaerolineae bacterium CFX3]MDL1926539.1 hypothetical protein [Anaerolineae bacterium AMX1]OQY85395.1 MAG: hypothetical protein B6D40_03635 [Anaerolineae bacterium UTCFX3]GER78361.1 conserved hypothetical protein [Candidatus Denitrolinea symbiosum]GJQ38024.1 MAG: hypothetical protein JETCAE02_